MSDGGPAFPTQTGTVTFKDGMTLRDYFAAKALPVVHDKAEDGELYQDIAAAAYYMADAMIGERTKAVKS